MKGVIVLAQSIRSIFVLGVTLGSAPTLAESALEVAAFESIAIYATERKIERDLPTQHFVGFSSRHVEAGVAVEIFHADSPIDILVNQYDCFTDAPLPGPGCRLAMQVPRCFYSADTGRFSISDFDQAFAQGIRSTPRDDTKLGAVAAVKLWQSGYRLFGRFLMTESAGAQKTQFVCARSETGLGCLETSDPLPNEP
jgi:hypothetical protein